MDGYVLNAVLTLVYCPLLIIDNDLNVYFHDSWYNRGIYVFESNVAGDNLLSSYKTKQLT